MNLPVFSFFQYGMCISRSGTINRCFYFDFLHDCSKLKSKLNGNAKGGEQEKLPGHKNINIKGTMQKGKKQDHCPERKI